VLVHNRVAHTKDMPVGLNGFRIWTLKAEPGHLLCKCGWQGLTHYHFKGARHRSFTPAQLEKRLGVKPGWYAECLAVARMDEEWDRQRQRERRGRATL